MSALLRRKRREAAEKAKVAASDRVPEKISTKIVEKKSTTPARAADEEAAPVRRGWLKELLSADEDPGKEKT